jgi:hypothetical protein
MALTLDEVLDEQLPRYCTDCGTDLPLRGAQCAACGWLPEVTRAELAETLSVPGALARIEAERLIGEGEHFREQAAARFSAAQRVLAADAAVQDQDAAQVALDAALGELDAAEVALTEAGRVADAAAGQLDEAEQTHRRAVLAEEGARRGKAGPAAETDALARLNAAVEVLARYRIPAEETAAARQAAVARVAAAEGNATALEDARDRAVLAVQQLRDPSVQVTFEQPDDGLTGPLKQMAAEAQQRLLESQRRPGKDEAAPVAVNGTVYPPNAAVVPGAVYSPGTPFPR